MSCLSLHKFKRNANPGEFAYVAIKDLLPPPWSRFETADVDDLVDSIAQVGILNPIIVCPSGDKYRVLAGWRRVLAAKKLNITHIPARVVNVRSEIDQIKALMHENTIRKNLSTREILSIIQYIRDRLGVLGVRDIAKITGLGKSTVARYLMLLEFPQEIRELILEKNLRSGIVDYVSEALKLGAETQDIIRCLQSDKPYACLERLITILRNAKELDKIAKKVLEFIREKDIELAQYTTIKTYPSHARLEVKILDEELAYWLHADFKYFLEHLDVALKEIRRRMTLRPDKYNKKELKVRANIMENKIEVPDEVVKKAIDETQAIDKQQILIRVVQLLSEAAQLLELVKPELAKKLKEILRSLNS